jgi:hypothetical protein
VDHHHSWSSYDRILCTVIARNLNVASIKTGFLALLDTTEQHLKKAVQNAAAEARFRYNPVWNETVRAYGGILNHGRMKLPCSAVLTDIRNAAMSPRRSLEALAIQGELLERALSSHRHDLALCALTNDWRFVADGIPIDSKLNLVRRGLESGIGIIQLGSIDLLQSMRREMDDAGEIKMQEVRELLEGFETKDIMMNSLRLEVLASYGGLELLVSPEDALSEMKSLVSTDAKSISDENELAQLAGMSSEQLLREQAYGYLSKMFEDIYQGVYWDAYHELEEEERRKILCLAGMAQRSGFWSDWVLSELLRDGSADALPVFRHWASGVDAESFSPQEAVASFILGIQGCANFDQFPPPYRDPISTDDKAWKTIGEILFWSFCGGNSTEHSGHIEELWASLHEETSLAVADILYQLAHSQWRTMEEKKHVSLEDRYPEKVRPLLELSLRHRSSPTSLFRYGGRMAPEVIRNILATLGRIGDAKSIFPIAEFVDDQEYGKDAIKAIEEIRRRMSPSQQREVVESK